MLSVSLVVHVREKENKFLLEKRKKKSKRGYMMDSSLSNCGWPNINNKMK